MSPRTVRTNGAASAGWARRSCCGRRRPRVGARSPPRSTGWRRHGSQAAQQPIDRHLARARRQPPRPAPPPCRPPGPWPCIGPSSGPRRGHRGWPRSSARRRAAPRCATGSSVRYGMPTARPVRQVLPARVRARSVVLDGRTAQPDLVVELPRGQDIVTRQPKVAVDAARLAHADLTAEADQAGGFVARHPIDEEARVFQGLAPAGHLGLGQEVGVGGVDRPAVVGRAGRLEAGHDRRGHARRPA